MDQQKIDISINIVNEGISLDEKLANLPAKPGVYQFKSSEGKVLYVGKAMNLRNRVRQYFLKFQRPDPRLAAMISKISDVDLIVTDSEVEALILEATLIKKLRPHYNVELKDDKSYPYIVITNEPFPRVFVTRRIIRDGSKYFGPYTDVGTMRASLKMIREIFKVRSCNYVIDDEVIRKRKIKVCLDYHIKKCEGPCEGLVSSEKYNEMINEVAQVLKGKTASLVTVLKEKMNTAAEQLRFEEAAELRDKIQQLSVYSERQKVIDSAMADRDLFAVVVEADDACGVVFKVRDGKIIGRHDVYMHGVEDKSEEEIVEQFIEHYYLEAEDIPEEIFLSVEVDNAGTLQQWLMQKRGQAVEISVPKIGDKAKLMAMCKTNAQFLLDALKIQKAKQKDYIPHSVKALQRDLRLPKPPRRIECFDISNIQGKDSVASMVVFMDGRPRKSEYRKFKIRSVAGSDDFASMREVIERRYSRLLDEQGELPDLIVVDGGKGQLSSAVEVLVKLGLRKEIAVVLDNNREREQGRRVELSNLPVIGLAKRLEEVFIPETSEAQSIPKTSSGLRLLQQIRNEAHRFAITYHRKLREKRTLQTELDLIEGIGKKRAKELLEVFGSVQGVKFATEEQIAEIVGEKIAAKIKEYFMEEQSVEV
ncbi:MAG: excinuclease ABC subunit C [Ignavibacteriae bacterium]|nr:excinuclease ABC subunit C [Ignavibacteriota bacterium]